MKITLITVCYNAADHIANALESVSAQTYRNIEHLVIDGASSDGTQNLVRLHPKQWRRLVSEPDHGIYDAMNKGLQMATGDVIGFINADDFYASDDVLDSVASAFADASVDACHGDLCYVRRDDVKKIVRYWRSSPFSKGAFSEGWCPPHPTFFARKSVYQRLGGFKTRYRNAADFELMARFLEVHSIQSRYVPRLFVNMRLGGTSNKSWGNVWKQNREIIHALRENGLPASLPTFFGRKLLHKGRQFLARPA